MAGGLGSKIKRRGGAVEDVLRNAERAVENLVPAYEKWAQQDLERLRGLFESSWPAAATRADAVKVMRKIVHDMKGQGTSFSYPLCSEVAGQLCKYLDTTAPHAQSEVIIRDHVAALARVLNEKIKGDGGVEGAGIRRALADLSGRIKGARGDA
jgi:hypothetical protein